MIARAAPLVGGSLYGGRFHSGQTVRWDATNIRPESLLAAHRIDFAAPSPGPQIPGITAPGTIQIPIPVGYNPGLLGATLYSQFVVLNPLGGDVITAASQAMRHTVGLN